MSLCPFPTTITITPRTPPTSFYLYLSSILDGGRVLELPYSSLSIHIQPSLPSGVSTSVVLRRIWFSKYVGEGKFLKIYNPIFLNQTGRLHFPCATYFSFFDILKWSFMIKQPVLSLLIFINCLMDSVGFWLSFRRPMLPFLQCLRFSQDFDHNRFYLVCLLWINQPSFQVIVSRVIFWVSFFLLSK